MLGKVRTAVEFIIGRGNRIVLGEIGLTPRAKKVIELAVDEAKRMNHHYIGTEHLLLGLVRDIRAQYQLGQMYFTGSGVALDYVSAYVWFALAAGQAPLIDNRKALLEMRNIAAARMKPEQVAEAARRVAAWKPR